MTKLIPNRLLMDVEFALHYRAKPPAIDGSLSGWTDADLLPALCLLDDEEPFAPVWACWNEKGLYIACRVTKKTQRPQCDPRVYWKSDNLRLCTDMRDARGNKRATRYCQQFFFLPTGGGDGSEPVAGSAKIHRAREDAPLYSSDKGSPRIEVASIVKKTEYTLEAHLPADCLNGFDPAEHERIGFYYIVEDRDRGQQYLTVGDDLNWHIDPSTWATAVLSESRARPTGRPARRRP